MSGHTGYPCGVSGHVIKLTRTPGLADALVRSCTAFRSWGELLSLMAGGYVPTLYGRTWREMALRDLIRLHGLKMYPAKV